MAPSIQDLWWPSFPVGDEKIEEKVDSDVESINKGTRDDIIIKLIYSLK